MLESLKEQEKLPGRTALLVDVSGSMMAALSRRSEMLRVDAAYGVAILLREICRKAVVFTFSNDLVEVPPRRGFALRDALEISQSHGGTYLGRALAKIKVNYDRIIVITDEQSHDRVPGPRGRGYVINVASNKNGVGYRGMDPHRRLRVNLSSSTSESWSRSHRRKPRGAERRTVRCSALQ